MGRGPAAPRDRERRRLTAADPRRERPTRSSTSRPGQDDSGPPRLFNPAYSKSDQVDNDIKKAQLTTDSAEKAKFYKDAQETIYKDAPWAPLVVEKLLSAHNKKLTGVYVIPDASFNFTEIDLK